MIPVRATAIESPFWMNCGNKYIADKIIPKSIMTNRAPVRNCGIENIFKFKIGFSNISWR